MELEDLNSCSHKYLDQFRSTSRPLDDKLPGRPAEFQSLLRRDVSRLLFRAKKEGIDEPFESRLSGVNQEFASLLQEACALPNDDASSQRRSISEILVRAVRCAAKQYVLLAELGDLALVDELTGLYNRRGFMAIAERDRKSTRLNSSHRCISYAVFCLKKKKN